MRVLLVILIAFGAPAAVYVLWRTFAPVRAGGSEEIHKGGWEDMPWLRLALAGVALLIMMLIYLAFDLDTGPLPAVND